METATLLANPTVDVKYNGLDRAERRENVCLGSKCAKEATLHEETDFVLGEKQNPQHV